jgi:hypothetical protein
MVTTSFKIRPETRFHECTIKPSRIGEIENFPTEIAARQSTEREWFKDGLNVCTYCTALLLEEMRDDEGAKLFWNQSELFQVDTVGHGEKVERAGVILRRTGLISDGILHPRIATRFAVSSEESALAPKRCATFRHLDGHGKDCKGDSEHESVIKKIRSHLTSEFQGAFPGCDIESRLNIRIADDLTRRPDILFTITGDAFGEIPSKTIAIEVQRSRLKTQDWRQRNQDLWVAADSVVWIFEKSRSRRLFRSIIEIMLPLNLPVLVYDIKGIAGSNDGTLHLAPPDPFVTKFAQAEDFCQTRGPQLEDGNTEKGCENANHRHAIELEEKRRVKVSGQSKIICPDFVELCELFNPSSQKLAFDSLKQAANSPLISAKLTPAQSKALTQVSLGADPEKQESLPELTWRDFEVGSYVYSKSLSFVLGPWYSVLVPRPRAWNYREPPPDPNPVLYVRSKGSCVLRHDLFSKSKLPSSCYRLQNGEVVEILMENHHGGHFDEIVGINSIHIVRLNDIVFFENPMQPPCPF